MNKSESKYFHTAAKMDEALLALLEKKDFEYITIKEICAKAGVNRSTFYLHYETTRDLLTETLEYMNFRFQGYFAADRMALQERLQNGKPEELMFLTPEYLMPYLAFIKDHERLFSAALKRPETFQADVSYRKMFVHLFHPIMEQFRIPEGEREYILQFYINGILGLVREWLKKGCAEPAGAIADMIIRYSLPIKNGGKTEGRPPGKAGDAGGQAVP